MNNELNPPTGFEVMADFNRLYSAYLESRKGKRWKCAVVRFEVNVLENIMFLHFMLTKHKYRPSPYNYFLVHEPKERLIMYNGFRDKIIQHSLCDNVLGPLLSKTFIYDNYASQKGKGTHFGLDRLKSFMQRYYRQFGADGWVLKCDISKYFYRINHDVLKSQLRRVVHDPDVLWLLDLIIDATEGPGIPIGNHTSQWFAILYLSGMDHMIKERLGIKFYGRYMDDFYLIHPDKEYLQFCLREIHAFMASVNLELNEKTHIFPLRNGIDFLGFHSYLTDSGKVIRKLRHNSVKKMRAKLRYWAKAYPKGKVDRDAILASWQAWDAHAAHGNTWRLRQEIRQQVKEILKEDI